jgi:hypothetical protein
MEAHLRQQITKRKLIAVILIAILVAIRMYLP